MQRTEENRRGAAVVGRQVGVAAREGKTIRFADQRARDDLDGKIEIRGHAGDDRDLLRILAAEVRAAGPRDREQLRDDGRHAVEVNRPLGAAQSIGQSGDVHRCRRRLRVHLRDARCEHRVDTFLRARLEVANEIARISPEVFGRAELQRVDEDRDHDEIGLRTGGSHERTVAFGR